MKRKCLVLFTILIFAFIIRLSLINFGLPSKNLALTTYNPDEAITFYSIEKWQPKKLYFHPYDGFFWGGFHLYPVALSLGIAKVLGCIKVGNREFYINNLTESDKLYLVARILMVLLGVSSTLVLFLILRLSYNEFTGIIAAGLLAITPAHVFNSIYVRPDIMMLFFGLLAMYFSVKIMKTKKTKYYILACICVGFATGTKLSGAVYGIAVILAHFLSNDDKKLQIKEKLFDFRLYSIPFFCLLGFIISSPYVVIDFNFSSESFLSYLLKNFGLAKQPMDLGQFVLFGSGPLSYFRYYLPYGLGKVMVYTSILGIILIIYNVVKEKNKFDIFFLISGLIVLFVISSTKNQAVWYTFPVMPFVVIYVVRGIELLFDIPLFSSFSKWGLKGILSTGLFMVIFGYTFVYTISYWKLYTGKNVREECSEWILKNIPKGSKVAIARSYFWTPPVLRQYNPPYKILMGSEPVHSSVQDGVLGLKNLLKETEYVVLTEYEYRWALHPKLQKFFPEHKKVLDEIFFSGKFKKLAEFDKQAKFLWFRFDKNYPPGDWLIPNPKIVVYQKVYNL